MHSLADPWILQGEYFRSASSKQIIDCHFLSYC